MVRTALLQVQDAVPQDTLSALVRHVVAEETRSVEIRAMAVRCLEHVDQPLARSALSEIVVDGKTMFGKVKMSAKSPVVVEALRILARKWSSRPGIAEILASAAKSKDAAIRAAARVEGGEG